MAGPAYNRSVAAEVRDRLGAWLSTYTAAGAIPRACRLWSLQLKANLRFVARGITSWFESKGGRGGVLEGDGTWDLTRRAAGRGYVVQLSAAVRARRFHTKLRPMRRPPNVLLTAYTPKKLHPKSPPPSFQPHFPAHLSGRDNRSCVGFQAPDRATPFAGVPPPSLCRLTSTAAPLPLRQSPLPYRSLLVSAVSARRRSRLPHGLPAPSSSRILPCVGPPLRLPPPAPVSPRLQLQLISSCRESRGPSRSAVAGRRGEFLGRARRRRERLKGCGWWLGRLRASSPVCGRPHRW
ncbi:uncharacterized protein A4U43_C10F270 [Asparagus officinalis]|uniref:Uncharacterized protein n=1 Tax=Asparagus officinalis TaxID=4686 RepID=A0A5P1E3V1_ASPOF|nr:uncharacterized protein A4U43_C10F270 [Asparagus officinalis]